MKQKVDMFVYGNIVSCNDVQADARKYLTPKQCFCKDTDSDLDLTGAIIVKGDLIVDNINFGSKLVVCTGDIAVRWGDGGRTLTRAEVYNILEKEK